jgi:hypothetical protein
MKIHRFIPALALVLGLATSAHALVSVSVSYTDNTTTGLASKSQSTSSHGVIGATSASLSEVGTSATLGYRFTGSVAAYSGGSSTQTINVSVTWTIQADDNDVYSIALAPEFQGYLIIQDGAADEPDDSLSVSTLNATLRKNGSTLASTGLNLNGGSLSTAGTSNIGELENRTLSNLTGTTTIKLSYTSTISAVSSSGLLNGNTSVAALWGEDSPLRGGYYDDDFATYPTNAARNADGLSMPATITLTEVLVPEPSTYAALAGLATLGAVCLARKKNRQG